MVAVVYDPKVIWSLRKSRIRRTVLHYLVNIYPNHSYPSEIARNTNLRPTDVCGVLNGLSDRFKEENSLVNLELVEKNEENNVCVYCATKIGCKVWKLLSR